MTQRMRLVPEVATEEMCHALAGDCDWSAVKGGFQADYEQMIAASPNGGCVTDADLERAARARGAVIARRNRVDLPWEALPEKWRTEIIEDIRAIVGSLGLALASRPTQTGE
jgi:hypothetical protein